MQNSRPVRDLPSETLMAENRVPGVLSNIRWETFMAALSILTVVNALIILYPGPDSTDGVAAIIQVALTPFFAADFLARLFQAESKIGYMLKGLGWADLLSALFFYGMRLFRVFSIYRFFRYVWRKDRHETLMKLASQRSEGTLLSLILLTIVSVMSASIYVLKAEAANPEANIKTAGEALWWAYVTVTTVGYGDFAPVTTGGRLVAMLLMSIGVGLIGVAAAYLSNWFLKERPKRRREKLNIDDSILEMRKLIEEQEATTEELHRRLDDLAKLRSEHTE